MYARESFTIAEVADLLSIRRLSDSYQDEFPVECPFCGDLRGKCSFCIRKNGELKNVYHCYHCGAAGNMLTLYAELSGIYPGSPTTSRPGCGTTSACRAMHA